MSHMVVWAALVAVVGVFTTAGVTWFVARRGRSDRGFERAEDRVQAAIDKVASDNTETQWIGVSQLLALLESKQVPATMYPLARSTLEAVYSMKARKVELSPGASVVAEFGRELLGPPSEPEDESDLLQLPISKSDGSHDVEDDVDDEDGRTELTP